METIARDRDRWQLLPPANRYTYTQGAMRILMVNNIYPPQVIGGAEIVMRRHARRLAARGHHVAILAGWLPGFPGEEGEMDSLDGLRVYRFPFRSWDQHEDFWRPGIEDFLDAILRQERPELVHAHNLRGLGVNLISAARRRGLPVFVTLHDHWWHCHWATRLRTDGTVCADPHWCGLGCCPGISSGNGGQPAVPVRLRRDTLLRALDGATRLIAPSASLARAHEQAGIIPGQIMVLSNGLDLGSGRRKEARQSAEGDTIHFVTVASLAEHKGIPDLLDAAALLHADPTLRGRWRLTIAGSGQLSGMVEADIGSGRLGEGTTYVGQLPHTDVLGLLATSDVVVLPSRWPENEPVVLLEAAAAGAAQIATDLGGSAELVRRGRSGELVAPRNPLALAAAMAAYVRAPAVAALHGTWNTDRRASIDEETTITTLEKQYAEAFESGVRAERPPVVLCGGSPTSTTAALVNRLHLLEPPGFRLRLVWHGWAQPEDWADAAFYWDWGGQPSVRERALLAGLPVLAMRTGAASPGIITYGSALEAAAALISWPQTRSALSDLRCSTEDLLQDFWRDAGPAPVSSVGGHPAATDFERELGIRAQELARRNPGIAAELRA